MPSATEVYRILRNMGERGLLRQFPAVARRPAPRPGRLDRRNTRRRRPPTPREQREAVSRALSVYAPAAMVVFDVDFGHTDPQVVIPYGGRVRVDGPARAITVTY